MKTRDWIIYFTTVVNKVSNFYFILFSNVIASFLIFLQWILFCGPATLLLFKPCPILVSSAFQHASKTPKNTLKNWHWFKKFFYLRIFYYISIFKCAIWIVYEKEKDYGSINLRRKAKGMKVENSVFSLSLSLSFWLLWSLC